MRTQFGTLAPLLLLAAATAGAEQLYVEDKLVLNVYSEAHQGGSRVATIETGDVVEALERVDNFVHVQLSDGREGWVGANYLSAQPPAIVKLKALQSSSASSAAGEPPKALTDEIARLKKQNSTLQTELAELKKKSSTPASSLGTSPVAALPAALAAPPERLDVEPAALPPAEPTIVIERSYWWAWALAVIAAGGAGFTAGYQTLGRRVRERFGGVKVY
jgi:hypothetical protein